MMKRWRAQVICSMVAVAAMAGLAAPAPAQFLSDSTTFLDAVSKRDGDKTQELLDKKSGTIILSRNPKGESVLHIVVKRRDMTWLQYMLAKGAPINARDDDGFTALADAARIGWAEGANQLLQVGATADLANNRGETPLILATQAHDVDTVRALLQYGADPKKQDHVAGMSAHDYAVRDGRSAAIVKAMDETKPVAKKAVSGPSL